MAYKTIKLKNYSNIFIEGEANAAVKPGMLVELMSTGKFRAHSGAGKDALPQFVLEDVMQGKTTGDAFVAGDMIQIWIPGRGDEVAALVADEQNIAIGDFLISNGAGYLTKYSPESWESNDAQQANSIYTNSIVAQALEALDLTSLSAAGSSDTPARQLCKVRIV
jgi:hypothetical protein